MIKFNKDKLEYESTNRIFNIFLHRTKKEEQPSSIEIMHNAIDIGKLAGNITVFNYRDQPSVANW